MNLLPIHLGCGTIDALPYDNEQADDYEPANEQIGETLVSLTPAERDIMGQLKYNTPMWNRSTARLLD